jgi:hypothetical protein
MVMDPGSRSKTLILLSMVVFLADEAVGSYRLSESTDTCSYG